MSNQLKKAAAEIATKAAVTAVKNLATAPPVNQRRRTYLPVPDQRVVKKLSAQRQRVMPRPKNASAIDSFASDVVSTIRTSFAKFEVLVSIVMASAIVMLHPNGIDSGPIGEWRQKYPDSGFAKTLSENFSRFLAILIFLPLYFAVPYKRRTLAIVVALVRVLLAVNVSNVEHFIISAGIFLMASVKRVETRMGLFGIFCGIYYVYYHQHTPMVSSGTATRNSAQPAQNVASAPSLLHKMQPVPAAAAK